MRLYPTHLTIRNLHLRNKFFPKIIYSNSNRITLSVFKTMQLESRFWISSEPLVFLSKWDSNVNTNTPWSVQIPSSSDYFRNTFRLPMYMLVSCNNSHFTRYTKQIPQLYPKYMKQKKMRPLNNKQKGFIAFEADFTASFSWPRDTERNPSWPWLTIFFQYVQARSIMLNQ